jgi:leader peptidase (prepilin peptidase)/N-methyltransferase
MYSVFVFLFGLIIGSFVNVLIYRFPRGESVARGRSHCVNCGEILGVSELVPILSYILLKGRCKHCGTRISIRYPVVELLCGAVFISFYLQYSLSFEFICYSAFFSLLLGISFIDIEFMIIPNRLVFYSLVIAMIAFIYNILWPLGIYGDQNPLTPLLGLIPGAVFFFLVFLVSKALFKTEDSVGMGDIKLLIPIGLILGFGSCLIAVFISVVAGGVAGAGLVLTGVKKRKDPIPFGPFLVFGSYFALLFARGGNLPAPFF